MLESLYLKNVGPAPEMEMELAPRLNLITGDNGLGKSFLLDTVWWALTRKWPHALNPRLTSGYPARPTKLQEPASIGFRVESKTKSVTYESKYVAQDEAWQGKAGRPVNPGLVVYAHADGGFSVWDPARNYWKKKGNIDVQERLPGYVLSAKDVWEGLKVDIDGRDTVVCNGLVSDWASWIRERGENAARMEEILGRLAPTGETMEVGPLMRLSIMDARDIPSIRTPYANQVPILHASAGVRRAVGLAYMLMWSWNEHMRATEVPGRERTRQVVMLFDEIESHLHPRWQRTILGSMLHVAESLHPEATVQLITATHSPLILASAEPIFDATKDAWFDLDFEEGRVVLRKRTFVRRGEVSNWLTSEAFDLKSARSLEAEAAIEEALALLRTQPAPSRSAVEAVDQKLRQAALPDIDPFWVRWGHFVESTRPAKKKGKR
jgi:AAA domain, putative AbiEii toxin, Type IV TA system